MKKLIVLVMALALVSIATSARAEGDFEMSGHVNTGFGFQYRSASPFAAFGGAFTQEGMIPYDFNFYAAGSKAGKLTHTMDILGYVGEAELDITKTFGENIRLRTDLDFARVASNSYGASVANMIEQAYATVNIPVGNGMEFLVGRFNAPMGFEAVDNNDNDLPFHTVIFNFLRPQNLTGIKFYYPFSDLIDLHVWIANNLMDVQKIDNGVVGMRQIPAFGLRLGFSWGEEGQESTVGISGAASPEARPVNYKTKGNWSYLADLDFNVWVNDVFAIGGEGIYRVDDAARIAKTGTGWKNNTYYAGLLNLHYVFSDVWDGTLRYTYANDKNGTIGEGTGISTLQFANAASQYHMFAGASALGYRLQNHQIDLGINYHITDGAKIMMMYRFDYIVPAKMGLARSYLNGNKTAMDHSLAANFAYEF